MNFKCLIDVFLKLIGALIPIVMALAILAFLIGLFKFIAKSGDTKNHAEGKQLIVWGLVALFLMLSLWGILRFASSELGFRSTGLPFLPTGASARTPIVCTI